MSLFRTYFNVHDEQFWLIFTFTCLNTIQFASETRAYISARSYHVNKKPKSMWKYECVCACARSLKKANDSFGCAWFVDHIRGVVCWTGKTCLTKFALNFWMTFIKTNKIFPLTWQCLKFFKLSKILSFTIVYKKIGKIYKILVCISKQWRYRIDCKQFQ